VEEELTIAFGAEDGAVGEVGGEAGGEESGRYFVTGGLMGGGVAYDASLPYPIAAHFELGLYEDDPIGCRGKDGYECGN